MGKKKLFFDLLYVILIVALLIFLVFVYKFMTGNAKQCLEDPIQYFQEKNEEAFCSCVKDGITWPNTVRTEKVEEKEYPPIDFSGLIIPEEDS